MLGHPNNAAPTCTRLFKQTFPARMGEDWGAARHLTGEWFFLARLTNELREEEEATLDASFRYMTSTGI